MGFWSNVTGWYRNRGLEAKKKKELIALDRLRRLLESEKQRITPLETIVAEMEKLVYNGKFEEAEKFVPELISMMKTKKMLDSIETEELKIFKRTMLGQLRSELRGIR
jgi:hypothetical protein